MTYPTLFGTGGHACLSQTFTPGTGYYGNVGLGRSPMQWRAAWLRQKQMKMHFIKIPALEPEETNQC